MDTARKRPRKISPKYLENAALYYLKRHSSTVRRLRQVLVRKVDASLRAHGGDRTQAVQWVDAVVEKLVRQGWVNDEAYASVRARSLRSAGRSARAISQKLRQKGLDGALVTQKVTEVTRET